MSTPTAFDIIVIGAGPAGQKAAIQGTKAGKRVALIERERGIGGSCVYRGTIPSKTLRESALQLDRLKAAGAAFDFKLKPDIQIATLLNRLEDVISAHDTFMSRQLRRNGISLLHGRACFLDERTIDMQTVDGGRQSLTADAIILATGSRPRNPENIPVDHEHILDSDSLLSMIYLPRSLTIIGGGVIGCEYASIFALLGTQVTLIDRAPAPLQFMDHELVTHFVKLFEQQGGRYLGGQQVMEVRWDGAAHVVTTLKDNPPVKSEKLLVALGRQANMEDLNLAAAGLTATEKGTLAVNQFCQTDVPHIYAVGDMVGAPALASKAMEQGRRAARHALNLPVGDAASRAAPPRLT
ncbi:MAG: FAD-dependent oxidoreductase [Nitrospira sp.]|nr:FAD-dependent oxidoreductase [Nitrospira sp.]